MNFAGIICGCYFVVRIVVHHDDWSPTEQYCQITKLTSSDGQLSKQRLQFVSYSSLDYMQIKNCHELTTALTKISIDSEKKTN